MDWFKKIFKSYPESKIREDDGGGYYSHPDHHRLNDDNQNEIEDAERESIDLAIALSLQEEEEKQDAIYTKLRLDEDEKIARALQDSFNTSSFPSNSSNGIVSNVSFPENLSFLPPSGLRSCSGCNREITHGRFLSCIGGIWHPECFLCYACKKPISTTEFSASGKHPYHKSCFKNQYHPKCDVCAQFIPYNPDRLIEYRAHSFWLHKYCPSHEYDGTARCCSCERLEARGTGYVPLEDGRKLCLECLDSAIMDRSECQLLFHDIKEFYRGIGMEISQEFPLLLVERQALNEAINGERNGHLHLPETRGICLSEEQTVRSILRWPKMKNSNRSRDIITEPFNTVRHCEVTAILILYGLPRLLTGAILAHETMHAWLRINGFRNLSQDIEEGICQVVGHMWLENKVMFGFGSTSSSSSAISGMDRKLGEFFKHQIEVDPSPVYGDGFRAGKRAVVKYGLRQTLEHMGLNGTFPV
ncbi:LIM domain-binding protein 3 [Zostera marina]|uniref:LIM domain-binding protein 3 n=1 Tax=Zostera marina TaxID=29655 RepID=A0A0K9NR56_ZOSMR|nr:LIM domain-binding protein 3 [Zostera marina]